MQEQCSRTVFRREYFLYSLHCAGISIRRARAWPDGFGRFPRLYYAFRAVRGPLTRCLPFEYRRILPQLLLSTC